tara:strand:+ start:5478 stop:5600 length:123 start_codon:yes stop_codon:yes gene_type:complete
MSEQQTTKSKNDGDSKADAMAIVVMFVAGIAMATLFISGQ